MEVCVSEFWKPNKSVRSQINRGDRKWKEYTERIAREAEEERRLRREYMETRRPWYAEDVPF